LIDETAGISVGYPNSYNELSGIEDEQRFVAFVLQSIKETILRRIAR